MLVDATSDAWAHWRHLTALGLIVLVLAGGRAWAQEEQTDSSEGQAAAESSETDAEDVPVEEEQPVEEEPPESELPPTANQPPAEEEPPKEHEKQVIGATAVLMETKSELLFRARVDTGAKSCSLHIEEYQIEDASEASTEPRQFRENIGKTIKFRIKNGSESTWLVAKITGYVIVNTSDASERRYKVPLTFRWKSVEKTVLVTLNNRNGMEYPLLLGRNFLRGNFLVDVELDSND